MAVKGLKWLRLYNWGGLHNQDASTVIAENEAQLARNHIIERNGCVEKRHGKTAYGGASTPNKASAIKGMIRAYSGQGGYGMKTAGTDDYTANQLSKALLWLQADTADDELHLYYGTDSTGAGTDLKDFAEAGTSLARLRAVQWGNRGIFMAIQGLTTVANQFLFWGLNTNASAPGGLWNARLPVIDTTVAGTEFREHAGTASTNWSDANKWIDAALTVEIGPGGDYGTWSESVGSTRLSAAGGDGALQITAINNTAYILGLTKPAANCRTVNLYTTDPQAEEADAGAAPLYLCKTVYYDADDESDGTLSIEWDAEHGENLDYSRPCPTTADTGNVTNNGTDTGNFKCLAVHNDRLWAVVAGQADRVWYSNLSKPHEFAATNFVDPGHKVREIVSYQGALIICTEPALFRLSGWSPDELGMSIEKASSKGTTSQGSVVVTHIDGQEMLFRLWHKQIWAYDGTQDHWIGYPVQATLDDMTWAQANNCYAVAWRNKVFFGFPDVSQTLVFDCVRKMWYLWEGWTPNCWATWNGVEDNGQLYWGDSTTGGMIYRVAESGYELCNFRYKTKAMAPEGPDTKVLWRWFRVEADKASFPLTLSFDIDFGGIANEISIPAPPSSGWDFGTWGGFEWQKRGDDRYEVSGPMEKGLVGTYIAVEPNRYDDGSKKIYGISLGYSVKGREAT